MVEFHKRFDPVYRDALSRARTTLGEFGFFHSFMSQPKYQLTTFKAWAGVSSDISYYLNSHHIDVHAWFVQGAGAGCSECVRLLGDRLTQPHGRFAGRARPVSVFASAATGTAIAEPYRCPPGPCRRGGAGSWS